MPLPLGSNRRSRGTAEKAGRHTRAAALTGVALTATALTAAIAPPTAPVMRKIEVALAAAAQPPSPSYGVGPLAGALPWALDLAKMNPLDVAFLNIGYDFVGSAAYTKQLYDQINALKYIPIGDIPNGVCKDASQDSCRTAFVFNSGIGALGVTDTIYALSESIAGNTRRGFDPVTPATGGTGLNNISAIYINNMLGPDGGLAARFPDLLKAFGLNPAMPRAGTSATGKDGTSIRNWITDFTWPYNTLADFPVTANPFALTNSLFAAVPPPALIQQIMDAAAGESITDALKTIFDSTAGTADSPGFGENALYSAPTTNQTDYSPYGFTDVALAALPPALQGKATGRPGDIFGTYYMLVANNPGLPILYPTYLASALVNPLLKWAKSPYLLGNPIADILAPAMKILVNIGYDDVLTPDKLNTPNPYVAGPSGQPLTYAQLLYKAYDRTFWQSDPSKPTPFAWLNNPAMTREQTTAAYVDAWNAFTAALKAQAEKPGFGIFVPNPDVPPAPKTAAVTAPAQAVSAAAAVAAPIEAAPVSTPDPAPVSAPDPVEAVPAPVVKDVTTSDAPADDAPTAPATPGRRGHAASAATGDSGGNDGGSNGGGSGHRGSRG